jgi:hypothetical protein
VLHIRCGTDIVAKLREAGLPGEILVWQDPVSHGPTPAGWSGAAWHRGRAAFMAAAYGCEVNAIRRELEEADAALDRLSRHDEVVLWFEHDLFDQSILVHLLAEIAGRPRGNAALSLVSIASHPEVSRFIGLGNLDANQLAALFPGRRPVTDAMLAAAERVWSKYVSADPRLLNEEARTAIDGLPWLPAALVRHLEELPWTTDELGRTERHALRALELGAATPSACFRAAMDMEEAPWLGDSMFYYVLAQLASRAEPLATVAARWPEDAERYGAASAHLTGSGRAVVRGERHAPPDHRERWVGGVRLGGGCREWRWDPVSRSPLRS